MNYLGVFHSNYPRSTAGVCDSPCIAKGRMMLCAPDVASCEHLLAMCRGRIRNRRDLSEELNCPANAACSYLILLAYRKWGEQYPIHIEGSAMSCIMDTAEDKMILSGDRMGEQLIFYTCGSEGRVIFSDHPDSLLKTGAAEPVLDREGLCEIFGLGPARTPGKTPLRDIKALEPGCMLTVKGNQRQIIRYFSIKNRPHPDDIVETVAHTRKLLEDAVDVITPLRPGVMLSGGLDSTALTALMCQRQSSIQSFSIDYVDNETDFRPNFFRPEMDAPYIALASEALGTRHQSFVLEQAMLAEALDAAVSSRGFPGMADIDSSLLLFSARIKPHVSSIVSGECGDEVFGGYPWFKREFPVSDSFPWSGSLRIREQILAPVLKKELYLSDYVKEAYRSAQIATGIDASPDDSESILRQRQLICFRYFMPNLQERAVRMCERSGLEVLTPLSDDRLVQYVFNVPWEIKFLNNQEKGLFRAAVKDLLPEPLWKRKKSPYPKTCSPLYTEIVRGMTMALLTDCEAPILEWIDIDCVRSIAESTLDPAATPWFGQLMAGPQMLAYLLQVNTWMRERNITVSL